eukprot:CAMPEP_0119389862 /NCGR_PEP_ID=MMETSP1334-20130426/111102_1 /TAXON_ID=127549 /ORGANISM="Calcidiscus leptoporus, Strain RCC1130" /LENGTH=150 /DNA_ID=CAMNT_0007412205 /DNA_START=69 /DNA_END=518 /DNA_ORIENTATION=-
MVVVQPAQGIFQRAGWLGTSLFTSVLVLFTSSLDGAIVFGSTLPGVPGCGSSFSPLEARVTLFPTDSGFVVAPSPAAGGYWGYSRFHALVSMLRIAPRRVCVLARTWYVASSSSGASFAYAAVALMELLSSIARKRVRPCSSASFVALNF